MLAHEIIDHLNAGTVAAAAEVVSAAAIPP